MDTYPLTLDIDYPDRPLSRLTTAFRLFTLIPIAIVLATLSTIAASGSGDDYTGFLVTGGALLVLPPSLTRARCSTTSWESCAGATGSPPTRSFWRRTNTRRSG